MLDNPETQARAAFGKFMRYLLVTLKMHEAEYLGVGEEYTVTGDDGKSMVMEQEKSLCARFLRSGMELFNTKVAKYWQRFDQFLELLYFFAVADVVDVEAVVFGPPEQAPAAADLDTKTEAARIGLSLFAKKNFLRLACDFMLGKKSPLCRLDETRPELGSYSIQPDFTHLVNVISLQMDDAELQKAYPLSDLDKEML